MSRPAAGPPMLLQLLGAPRLLQGDQAVRVGSRKALALLAVTALDAGVTRERLASLLWPEVEPAGARRNLRRELFRLRELGVPLVEAADGALSLDPALAVDALRLQRDEALPAVGLPAFEGLDGVGSPELDVWLQSWRGQLAERRLELLAREAGASEQRGDLAAALALHAQRLAAEPCDESAALQVMRLRAGLGDPVGALHDYQRYADALRDELDVAPSEAARLMALELRRRLGPAVEATAPVAFAAVAATPTGMPEIAPFVARGGSQQEIEAAWARGQRVYLHGPAGIGKTRLAS
ncbi:MAG: BTAD domain-containing putative transcriptional regulator, partial [Caldimonas sp.]